MLGISPTTYSPRTKGGGGVGGRVPENVHQGTVQFLHLLCDLRQKKSCDPRTPRSDLVLL